MMGARWVRCVPALLGPCLCLGAHAQIWEVFDTGNAGFPSNTVRAICHDSTGGTWVGTDWGLCHYDGASWNVMQVQDGLPENDVRALACDHQGRLWAGFFTQGLAILDGGVWTQYTTGASPMPSDQVRNITFDQQGHAWLSTTNGLAWTDLVDWRIYNDSDSSYNNLELPGVNISDVAVRSDGLVVIGTLNAGFVYLTDTLVRTYDTFNDQIPDNTALGVAIDAQGERWAACPAGGLMRYTAGYNDGLFFQYSTLGSAIPSNALNDVVVDPADRKILGTQNAGIAILQPGNFDWLHFHTGNSVLPDDEVNCLSLSPDGSLWAGTGNGGAVRLVGYALHVAHHAGRSLQVYPQPCSDRITVSAGRTEGVCHWAIRDLSGRLLSAGSEVGLSGPFQIDVGRLSSGSFALSISDDQGALTTLMVRR